MSTCYVLNTKLKVDRCGNSGAKASPSGKERGCGPAAISVMQTPHPKRNLLIHLLQPILHCSPHCQLPSVSGCYHWDNTRPCRCSMVYSASHFPKEGPHTTCRRIMTTHQQVIKDVHICPSHALQPKNLPWRFKTPPCANSVSLTISTVGFLASSRAMGPPGVYMRCLACFCFSMF